MNDRLNMLIEQMRDLEQELAQEIQKKEAEFFYEVRQRKVRFTAEVKAQHRKLAKRIHQTLLESKPLILLTAPLIWAVLLPLVLLDLVTFVFQAVCFPIYDIPKVRRSDYIIFDRGRLPYLNVIEKLGCIYCSYANGLLEYIGEIAARTEQHFCPIKHHVDPPHTHSRYDHFLPYGDARAYKIGVGKVRSDFVDITLNRPGFTGGSNR